MVNKSLTIIIPTFNRSTSLKKTLDSILQADREGIALNIIIVDNYGDNQTRKLVSKYQNKLEIKLITEYQKGKSFALNSGIAEGPLKRFTAILDDDLTLDRRWFQGVFAISERWPEKGYYTGVSRIKWPSKHVPSWARNERIHGWAFSVADWGEKDNEIPSDRWTSGNHFWVHSRFFNQGFRFCTDKSPDQLEMTEPKLMMELARNGFGGVAGQDALVYHSIQLELLEPTILKKRALSVGRGHAEAFINWLPQRRVSIHAKKRPLLSKAYALLQLSRISFLLTKNRLRKDYDRRLVDELELLRQKGYYLGVFRFSR